MRSHTFVGIALAMLTLTRPAAAELLPDHPLVDVIVEVRTGEVLSQTELAERLAVADYLLFGEKHDNARHHAIQAELVDAMGARQRLSAVAFEMLPTDRQAAMTEHLTFGGSVVDLDGAIAWHELGWGPWTWYGPIAHAAHRHGATLVAANLSRADIEAVYEQGLDVLGERFLARTGLDQPLAETEQEAREQRMVDAHCGHDLGPAAATMVDIQRARDARMAERLATLTGSGQGVLITGNAHADTNQGVPVVLALLQPEAHILSLGLVEVRAEWAEPAAEDWPYDYVWFTPRAKPADHDYCRNLRSRS